MEKLVIAHKNGACAEIIHSRGSSFVGLEGDGLVRITACTHQLQIGEV